MTVQQLRGWLSARREPLCLAGMAGCVLFGQAAAEWVADSAPWLLVVAAVAGVAALACLTRGWAA